LGKFSNDPYQFTSTPDTSLKKKATPDSDKEDTNAVIKGSPILGQRTKDLTSNGDSYATEQ
jgi:hypothetical protein